MSTLIVKVSFILTLSWQLKAWYKCKSVPVFLATNRTTALILLEYLSFKQFKLIVRITNNNMHVKMTRIESGVTVPKGLFTLYMNVKIVMA
jgi:hypothetical protein